MKGATIGHAKQRIEHGRYIGITEPGIIAAEPPNPIVNQLAIMPDIEKRLEAFVRMAHGIVVFPGGAGTAEEILYLAGILLDPANREQPFPIVLTGPAESAAYFEQIGRFIAGTLGRGGRAALHDHHRRPGRGGAAHGARHGCGARVPPPAQRLVQLQLAALHPARVPAALRGHARQRCARSSWTATSRCTSWPRTCAAPSPASSPATSRSTASRRSSAHGPYELAGDPAIMQLLDELLAAFVAQRRMKPARQRLPPGVPPRRVSTAAQRRGDITRARAAHFLQAVTRAGSQRMQVATCL